MPVRTDRVTCVLPVFCMNPSVILISKELERHFLDTQHRGTEFFVFLCGGSAPNQENLRRKVGEEISSLKSKYRYTAYYPEDMFIELILGRARRDLFSLENMLAQSAHAVAILLDGPGTFVELGAFANHRGLKDKLILVIDPRYQRAKSFINLGPVRYLRARTRSRIHHLALSEKNTKQLALTIAESTRGIARHSPPARDLTNPLFAYDFYLALVFVFEPIPREAVASIAAELAGSSDEAIQDASETVINTLINEGNIMCTGSTLSCTPRGTERLIYTGATKLRIASLRRMLTDIRYRVLNTLYRGRLATKGGAFDI